LVWLPHRLRELDEMIQHTLSRAGIETMLGQADAVGQGAALVASDEGGGSVENYNVSAGSVAGRPPLRKRIR